MDFTQKYIKYKTKYLELKYKLKYTITQDKITQNKIIEYKKEENKKPDITPPNDRHIRAFFRLYKTADDLVKETLVSVNDIKYNEDKKKALFDKFIITLNILIRDKIITIKNKDDSNLIQLEFKKRLKFRKV